MHQVMNKCFGDVTQLGHIEMKNRFIRAAVGDHTQGGHLCAQNFELYRQLARGGAGAIITGFTVVDKDEEVANIFSLADDRLVAEYRQLTDMIHEEGCKAIVQLVYLTGMVPTPRPLAPSAGKNIHSQVETIAMTKTDIIHMEQLFAAAARRAKEAGFDGVEIHSAHGFLHHQFFSPLFNHREDEYGGSTENRCRFLVETYQEVRQAVGEDFTVLMKIAVDDADANGVTSEDYLYLSTELSAMGIDGIEVSGMWFQKKAKERLYYREAAAQIADVVACKVIQTGGNRELDALEEELQATGVEYFGFARPFISQPDWVNLYLSGAIDKPRCTSCNYCAKSLGASCIFHREDVQEVG